MVANWVSAAPIGLRNALRRATGTGVVATGTRLVATGHSHSRLIGLYR